MASTSTPSWNENVKEKYRYERLSDNMSTSASWFWNFLSVKFHVVNNKVRINLPKHKFVFTLLVVITRY